MRMWMIEPELMCRQHLLGEHFEIHKLVGNLKNTGKWTNSLASKGFLEPQNVLTRHEKLVNEMLKRNMKHKSPLEIDGVDLPIGKVDINKSILDLRKRCQECLK